MFRASVEINLNISRIRESEEKKTVKIQSSVQASSNLKETAVYLMQMDIVFRFVSVSAFYLIQFLSLFSDSFVRNKHVGDTLRQ